MLDLRELSAAIIDGSAGRVKELVQAATDQGVPPEEIVTRWMVPALDEVGARFERHEYYVPEMLVAARAMQAGLALLRPLLAGRDIKPLAVAAIGTVRGDLHDIGKNLVAMMWEGAGLEVIDLGVDIHSPMTAGRNSRTSGRSASQRSRSRLMELRSAFPLFTSRPRRRTCGFGLRPGHRVCLAAVTRPGASWGRLRKSDEKSCERS